MRFSYAGSIEEIEEVVRSLEEWLPQQRA